MKSGERCRPCDKAVCHRARVLIDCHVYGQTDEVFCNRRARQVLFDPSLPGAKRESKAAIHAPLVCLYMTQDIAPLVPVADGLTSRAANFGAPTTTIMRPRQGSITSSCSSDDDSTVPSSRPTSGERRAMTASNLNPGRGASEARGVQTKEGAGTGEKDADRLERGEEV